MEGVGSLQVSWARGYSGTDIHHIDEDHISFICGSTIKFVNTTNKNEEYFTCPCNGISAFATHPEKKIFAVATSSLTPDIYICAYPEMKILNTLSGSASMECKHLSFSSMESYLAVYSGVPDFTVSVWNWSDGVKVSSCQIDTESEITSMSFNPLNWHEICLCGPTNAYLLSLEKCNIMHMIDVRTIKLPYYAAEIDKVNVPFQYLERSNDQPYLFLSSKARLFGPEATDFKIEPQQERKVEPKSHCWSGKGLLYIGCVGGQLLSVQTEMLQVTLMISGAQDDVHAGEVTEGMFNRLLCSNLGLFCFGTDGNIRRITIDKNGIKIVKEYEGVAEILAASFSPVSYESIVFSSTPGTVSVYNVKIGNCRTVFNDQMNQFVGAGFTDGGNICVSCNENGLIELWDSEYGANISQLKVEDKVTSFDVCPSYPLAVIGTMSGSIYHIDLSQPERPRAILRQYLYKSSVDFLQYTPLGTQIICCSREDRHIFLINASPVSQFECMGFIDCFGTVKHIQRFLHSDGKTHFSVVVIPAFEKRADDESSIGYCTSDRLLIFSLPTEESEFAASQFNTTTKCFAGEFINRLTFDLTIPLESSVIAGIDSQYHVFAIGLDDRKLLQFQFPTIQDDNTSIHNPSHEAEGHELQDGSLCMSSHGKWILSYSSDGNIIVRDKENISSKVIAKAHSYISGGISFAAWSQDGHKIVSCGRGDGSMLLYSWSLSPKGHLVMNSAVEFARNQDMILRAIAEKQESSLCDMTSIDLSDDQEQQTWYEQQLLILAEKENMEYDSLKIHLRENINTLRKTIAEMMSDNSSRPDIEQLNQEEYNLDVEQQLKLQESEERRVDEVREDINYQNLAERYLKYIMKKEFWDELAVKGLAVKAFNSCTAVANYAMNEIAQPSLMLLNKVSRTRAAEIEELKAQRAIVELSTGQNMADEEEDEDEGANGSDQLSLHGSVGPKYGGDNELFYSQFDMHTREEKINQIIFLKDAIHRIKVAFNKEFMNVYQNKEQEVARAKEKNIRIREIMQDLNMDTDNVKELMMGSDEKPEMCLVVSDHEVTVERVLSLEQQKQFEEEKKQEEARLEAAKKDNKRERGLQDMMGGVLEVKKEDILKQDLSPPEFTNEKPENEWTEEEKKSLKEFEKKQKDLQEEREKYRKNLENELKKLQQAVVDGMVAFDEQLFQLHNRKVKTEMVINQEESKILQLVSEILIDDEISTQELHLNSSIKLMQDKKSQIAIIEEEIRTVVDEHREIYDSMLAEDKLLDRSFKRDFSDAPLAQVDSLYKIFKRRPRLQRVHDNVNINNPYSIDSKSQISLATGARPLPSSNTSEAAFAALKELDDFSNAPEGVDELMWQRLCVSRRLKIESELRLKSHASSLAEITRYLQRLQDDAVVANSELEELTKQRNRLSEDRMKNSLNLEIQFLLKQGQVEVEVGEFVPNFQDSILLHRPVVEDLNATIKTLGEQKVAAMTECKDFKKGIHQLEWEHRRMMMQMDDLNNKARHIQMLKLAKDLQLYLSDDNYHARQARQMQTLEETLALQEAHIKKKVEDKQKIIRDLERAIQHREVDNNTLAQETEELHVSVSERKNIDEVNASERAKHTADSRLRGIVQRRKLVDLAKAQAQEVAVLRAEVERLRMKTFPALVQIER